MADDEEFEAKGKLDSVSMVRIARHLPNIGYEAKPADQTVSAYLHEAFKLLELRFSIFDNDQAGVVIFSKMARDLSKYGFVEEEKLEQVFRKVDADKTQTLDFMEFLCLIYFWQTQGDLFSFFRTENNIKMVKMAFSAMQKCVTKYDQDHNYVLNIHELDELFRAQFPAAFQSGVYQAAVDIVYPVATRQDSGGLSFRKFMMLIYHVLCDSENSLLEGKYKRPPEMIRMPSEIGPDSPFWKGMAEALVVLEEDFNRFDSAQNQCIDIRQITSAIPIEGKDQVDILDIHARLQHYFTLVDVSRSRTLDFYEYLYMVFLTTANGSYHELVAASRGATCVKRAFVELHKFYHKYDADKNFRLTWDELCTFCNQEFGAVPDNFQSLFDKMKYRSGAAGNQECLDLLRYLKVLYMLLRPDGSFHPDREHWAVTTEKSPQQQPRSLLHSCGDSGSDATSRYGEIVVLPQHKVTSEPLPPRFTDVDPGKFVPEKLLGEGGQGRVHLGTYGDVKCAGKTLLNPSAEMVAETVSEVDFFLKLEHLNCHYLLGANTSVDRGEILLLTEVCDQGSIFDIYSKEQRTFDGVTALRIAKECAQGYEHIHELGFMHRDIKSLNVFMTGQLQAKVADFGMCTNKETANDLAGTIQWMAPEVVKINYKKPSEYDKRCDIYSFGILLWEIFHCKIPYGDSGLGPTTIGRKVMRSATYRPDIHKRCPPKIQTLITQCWEEAPDARPTWDKILEVLDTCEDECTAADLTASI